MAIDWLLRFLGGGNGTVVVEQAGLLGELVEFSATLDQLCGRVELRHTPLVQNDDTIGVDDRVDAVRDRNDGSVLEDAAAQGALQVCVGFYVNRGLSLLLAEIVCRM
jgi:hypothetical protein